jgi:hypothetical protein
MTGEPKDDEPTAAEGDGVGYKKPPKRGQFKKGHSGNPRGGWDGKRANQRVKQAPRPLTEIIDSALYETVVVQQKGKRQRMPMIEVIIRQLVAAAGKGDVKAFALLQAARKSAAARPPEQDDRPKGGILVVYPTMEEDEWEEATEGMRQTINPLAGLPGGDEFYEKHTAAPRTRQQNIERTDQKANDAENKATEKPPKDKPA